MVKMAAVAVDVAFAQALYKHAHSPLLAVPASTPVKDLTARLVHAVDCYYIFLVIWIPHSRRWLNCTCTGWWRALEVTGDDELRLLLDERESGSSGRMLPVTTAYVNIGEVPRAA